MIKKMVCILLCICLCIPILCENPSSAATVWTDERGSYQIMEHFVMSGANYYGASRPETINISGQPFDTALRFWGKETEEYSGSMYTGRLYHEYLAHSDEYCEGEYITFQFYASGVSSCGKDVRMSVGLQTENSAHTVGIHSASSDILILSPQWKQYTVTVPVPSRKDPDEAGYRVILNLGYWGQTTYIADFKIYRSDSSEFSSEDTLEDVHITINGEETDHIQSGVTKMTAQIGKNLTDVSLMLALYDSRGVLEKLALSPSGQTGTVSAEMHVDSAEGKVLRGYVWDMNAVRPLDRIRQLGKSDTSSCFVLSMDGGTSQYPLVCKVGYPAMVTSDGLPHIMLQTNEGGEYQMYCTLPDGSTILMMDKNRLSAGEIKAFDTGMLFEELPLYGEYAITVTCRTFYGTTAKDSVYFRVCDEEQYGQDSVFVDGETLVYLKDYKGNHIPDYSNVGYQLGREEFPEVENKLVLEPSGGDDTARIQEAIDVLAAMPMDSNGFRGALLLKSGIWYISSTISITADGIVIRGEEYQEPDLADAEPVGTAEQYSENCYRGGTVLLATSKIPNDLLFSIKGSGSVRTSQSKKSQVIDQYVPSGTDTLTVADASAFNVGDSVLVTETANSDWISAVGMDQIPQRTTPDANPSNPDNRTIQWTEYNWVWDFERTIIKIEGNIITLDSPLTNAMEQKYGQITVAVMDDLRIGKIGLENLHAVALWEPNEDGVDDTRHAQRLLDISNAEDVRLKNITAEHFNTCCINIQKNAKRIEIDTFYNLIANKKFYNGTGYESTGRTFLETQIYVGRYGVYNAGQQVLMQHIYGINNRHLVEYSSRAAGPNVFYDGKSENALTSMGPHMMWSVGGLYDNVESYIAFQNRLNMGSGQGWAGAWYTAWNTKGDLVVQQPPTAQNYSVGHVGKILEGDFRGYAQGSVTYSGKHFPIESLFLYQSGK